MSEDVLSRGFLREDIMRAFEYEVQKYPLERRQSAVMACLAIVQNELGWISPEAEEQIAKYLEMPPIAVHEVATFYNMYDLKPRAKFKINICTNAPCMFAGGPEAYQLLQKKIASQTRESSNLFSVAESECLGACGDAPVLLVNDRVMCSFMTADKIDEMMNLLTKAGNNAS